MGSHFVLVILITDWASASASGGLFAFHCPSPLHPPLFRALFAGWFSSNTMAFYTYKTTLVTRNLSSDGQIDRSVLPLSPVRPALVCPHMCRAAACAVQASLVSFNGHLLSCPRIDPPPGMYRDPPKIPAAPPSPLYFPPDGMYSCKPLTYRCTPRELVLLEVEETEEAIRRHYVAQFFEEWTELHGEAFPLPCTVCELELDLSGSSEDDQVTDSLSRSESPSSVSSSEDEPPMPKEVPEVPRRPLEQTSPAATAEEPLSLSPGKKKHGNSLFPRVVNLMSNVFSTGDGMEHSKPTPKSPPKMPKTRPESTRRSPNPKNNRANTILSSPWFNPENLGPLPSPENDAPTETNTNTKISKPSPVRGSPTRPRCTLISKTRTSPSARLAQGRAGKRSLA
eukprot:NODE_1883_length_1268_cov_22.933552_g1472_i2.p1 GENE.NODE_1883_length_1268_cov_22.933552_g1472_i2~~NODE_1883_length_1268_cov_22.933552_g1472_i2.p1  ORF type:complete len:403 (-),score=31.10 NODE_1883_length_1268_cov_22.933552_g1472_i2:59-1246(-)